MKPSCKHCCKRKTVAFVGWYLLVMKPWHHVDWTPPYMWLLFNWKVHQSILFRFVWDIVPCHLTQTTAAVLRGSIRRGVCSMPAKQPKNKGRTRARILGLLEVAKHDRACLSCWALVISEYLDPKLVCYFWLGIVPNGFFWTSHYGQYQLLLLFPKDWCSNFDDDI